MELVRVCSENIDIVLGLEKCAALDMKWGKGVEYERIGLLSCKMMKEVDEDWHN